MARELSLAEFVALLVFSLVTVSGLDVPVTLDVAAVLDLSLGGEPIVEDILSSSGSFELTTLFDRPLGETSAAPREGIACSSRLDFECA